MAADFELNLGAGRACEGGRAPYSAAVYLQNGRHGIRRVQVELGRRAPDLGKGLLGFLDDLKGRFEESSRSRILAASVHRVCVNAKHEQPPVQPAAPVRLERVGAVVLAGTNWRPIEEVKVPPHEQQWHEGIGVLKLPIEHTVNLSPAIFLPVTPAEVRSNPVVNALEIFGPDGPAFVALRGLERVFIPEIELEAQS